MKKLGLLCNNFKIWLIFFNINAHLYHLLEKFMTKLNKNLTYIKWKSISRLLIYKLFYFKNKFEYKIYTNSAILIKIDKYNSITK